MEGIAIILILALLMLVISNSAINTGNNREINRAKMKRSILEIEDILSLKDSHLAIELDLMSDQELSDLYHESKSKFEIYISERNANNNKKALEDF